jgi:predicted Rossmann fold nucleotide-binding protein DprA/Smf involved in DNA uptake
MAHARVTPMTEIAQLFESALRQNRANLLRKAAINTVAKMPAQTTLRELLTSEAGASIRELTLVELREALAALAPARQAAGRRIAVGSTASGPTTPESREARLYRQIIEAITAEAKTIGQLAKVVDVDVAELRGYLAWMKKMGKIDSTGRARATRYHLPR